MDGLTFDSGDPNDLNGTFGDAPNAWYDIQEGFASGGLTGDGAADLQVGGWYGGKQWDGSRFGDPGQVIVGGTNTTTNTNTGDTGTTAPPPIDPFLQEIENAFSSKINTLNNIAGSIKGEQPGIEQDIRDQGAQSRATLETEKGITERKLGGQEEKGGRNKEDALTQARRLYSELTTGGQQRFGGASSAGEAYQALTGRELQRNTAQIGQQYADYMQQIEGARMDLEARSTDALKQLELQTNQAINQSRRDFQNRLREIDLLKGEAEENKAMRRLSALQEYRNQIFQANLAKTQGTQQIANTTEQLTNTLNSAQSDFENQANATGATGDQFATNAGAQSTQMTNLGPITPTGQDIVNNRPVGKASGLDYQDDELPYFAQPLTGALTRYR